MNETTLAAFRDELTKIATEAPKEGLLKRLMQRKVLIPAGAFLGGIYLGRKLLKGPAQQEPQQEQYGPPPLGGSF